MHLISMIALCMLISSVLIVAFAFIYFAVSKKKLLKLEREWNLSEPGCKVAKTVSSKYFNTIQQEPGRRPYVFVLN